MGYQEAKMAYEEINPYAEKLELFWAIQDDDVEALQRQIKLFEKEEIPLKWMDIIDAIIKYDARKCLVPILTRLDREPDNQSSFHSPYYYYFTVVRCVASNNPSLIHFILYNIPCKTPLDKILQYFNHMTFNEAMYAVFSHPALDKSIWDRLNNLHPNCKWNFYVTRWRDRQLLFNLRAT